MECPINHDGPTRRRSYNVTTSSSNDLDPSKLEEIPQPPVKYFGLLGHLPEIDPTFSISSFWRLMDTYGSIYRVNVHGDRIIVGTHELIRELFDEDTWVKVPGRPQQEMRAASGDGLFTAFLEEENWWKAHRLLQPAFGNYDYETHVEETPLTFTKDRLGFEGCSMTCKLYNTTRSNVDWS